MDVEPQNPEPPESHWIDLARAGYDEGWRELHRRYYSGLWHAAHQVLRDEALAEDVVQEAFIKAHRQIRRFRGDAKFSTWIYRITQNQALDTLRKQQRRGKWLGLFPLGGDDAEDGVPAIDAVDQGRTAAQDAALGDDRTALARALDTLSPDHRAVVELRLIQGFSTEETARILKLKKGTVLSRLFYSCQKLKKHLEPTYHEQ
jgi:RNA polymerase sigma-70 factor (ECF subfamily)